MGSRTHLKSTEPVKENTAEDTFNGLLKKKGPLTYPNQCAVNRNNNIVLEW